MSETKGMMQTCDRCGEWVFLKCTGEGEADGGFTRWNKFEPAPDGWNYITGAGTVCPKCWKEYVALLKRYKEWMPQAEVIK